MIKLRTSHLLTGEELTTDEILGLIDDGLHLKKNRTHFLSGKQLALLFDKPSLRTRFSFTVAMHELGGNVIESLSSTRKEEWPEDTIQVLSGYCHGVVVRTHQDSLLERMAAVASIPVINGLSDLHHPCQILSDFLTLQEIYGKLKGLTLSYIGDGNNILHSFLLMAPKVGINIKFACPPGYGPHPSILEKALLLAGRHGTDIHTSPTPQEAVRSSQNIYTDVWTSMGFENEKTQRDQVFLPYQVNEDLMKLADKGAKFMHCLPMERGKEVSFTLPNDSSSVIFKQSENRLHLQKALLLGLLK